MFAIYPTCAPGYTAPRLLPILVTLLGVLSAAAQLPTARLLNIQPAGGQIGNSFEVQISGMDLDEASELRFADTNISARPKLSPVTGLSEPNVFVVTISSNARPGICEARAVGRFGISNSRRFAVGPWPEAVEQPGNHSPETAMRIEVGSTINGQAEANAVDHFAISVRRGQRILIQCRAATLDSRLSPSMILCDANGREIARSRREELLDFKCSEDGTNILKVSDSLYRGGADFCYRLTVHTGPHIDFVLPPAALAGTTNKHLLYGRNLPNGVAATNVAVPGGALEELAVEIVAPAAPTSRELRPGYGLPITGFDYYFAGDNGLADPIFIGLASAPVVLERSGNDRAESAQEVTAPCEYIGQFHPNGDRDWITFIAQKGEIYWIEVISQRLGAGSDPFLLVQRLATNTSGEWTATDLHEGYDSEPNAGGPEFRTSSLDPAWRLEVKEEGRYRVQVRDLFGTTQTDPRRVYRLVVRRETPDFSLALLPPSPAARKEREVMPWAAVLRQGETVPMRVVALRRDNLGGDIELAAAGLPPGISSPGGRIEAGKNSGEILLTASPDATNWNGAITVVGRAKHGNSEIVRAARGGVVLWRVEDYNTEAAASRISEDVTLGIVPEPAPVALGIKLGSALETTAVGKLQVPLTITRAGDFAEKLKLKVAGAPGLESLKEIEVDAKATNVTVELDLAQAKVPAGTHRIYFHTQTKGKYSAYPHGAKDAETAAQNAEKNAAEARAMALAAAEKLANFRSPEGQAGPEQTATKEELEKEAASTAERAKAVEALKAALAARAREMAERAKPREITVSVYSPPFEIKVGAAPPTATAKK